ncbi:hypothetical protein ABT095_08790 [Kitasatospora sp. NPDC002227]|uniref:hypothetical protein n=1 Tax=Kitasatospora sp. NPDC002227 TaxID=3154773 RepID=UPI0033196C6B
MPSTESAVRELQEFAVLWSVGEAGAEEAVAAACAALVAGLDGPALRELAACSQGEAGYRVPELLPLALEELGLVFFPLGSGAAEEAAVRVFAGRLLGGEWTAREFADQVHSRFGHGMPMVARLAMLRDEYNLFDYGGRPAPEIDAEVEAEARRLVQ